MSIKCDLENCKKRCRLSNIFKCKCELSFCGKHKYPDEHNCKFDHKKFHKENIRNKNPKIEFQKVQKI